MPPIIMIGSIIRLFYAKIPHEICLFFPFSLFFLCAPAFAFYFRLDGDRIWLQAEKAPLVEILEQFARAGVEVRLDPRIQFSVTGAVRGKDLDEALETILESYDYLLTWKMLRGPLGRGAKIEANPGFYAGREAAARPIPKKAAKFDATRGVLGTSPEFVKDELLISVRSGATYERFKRLLDEIGGMIVEADAATGTYLIRFPPGTNVEALLQQLARHPLVAHVELNHVTRLPPRLRPIRPASPRFPPSVRRSTVRFLSPSLTAGSIRAPGFPPSSPQAGMPSIPTAPFPIRTAWHPDGIFGLRRSFRRGRRRFQRGDSRCVCPHLR